MAGAYCRYCDRRCFVYRILPPDAQGRHAGAGLHMATCGRGMQHDLDVTGYTHETAINPHWINP